MSKTAAQLLSEINLNHKVAYAGESVDPDTERKTPKWAVSLGKDTAKPVNFEITSEQAPSQVEILEHLKKSLEASKYSVNEWAQKHAEATSPMVIGVVYTKLQREDFEQEFPEAFAAHNKLKKEHTAAMDITSSLVLSGVMSRDKQAELGNISDFKSGNAERSIPSVPGIPSTPHAATVKASDEPAAAPQERNMESIVARYVEKVKSFVGIKNESPSI